MKDYSSTFQMVDTAHRKPSIGLACINTIGICVCVFQFLLDEAHYQAIHSSLLKLLTEFNYMNLKIQLTWKSFYRS